MKANNIPKVSDLSRWIDLQLSTITDGVSSGYTLGNGNTVWIDKGATVFNVSLANGETFDIDSDNYNTAEDIAIAILSALNETTPPTKNRTTMKTTTTPANLKGMAKHTYNRVTTAIAEDTTTAMLHTFAVLTDGAKAIALQSGKFSNLHTRGERKGMAVEEAAKELTERAAGCVTRKLRKIDHICAVAFLAEYISRQRKADEPTDNNPTTMNANETLTDRQNAVGYYDEDYNDCFFSSVDEAFEYVKAHNSSDDHTEKELNGAMLFGLGVYAYADIVTFSGVADCSRSNEVFYHFKDDSEMRRFIQYLQNTDGYLESV